MEQKSHALFTLILFSLSLHMYLYMSVLKLIIILNPLRGSCKDHDSTLKYLSRY